jgi:chemotaxis protein histidine kinase CheA/ActR/RegA family two-component response regulator
MDMLAELVMLRNRRESHVEQLKSVHSELVRCVSRLRAYEENYSRHQSVPVAAANGAPGRTVRKQRVSSLTEVANDLLELGGSLRELYEPVGNENMAISRFIRHFRQELIQLRRVPIGGLFQRLQRSIRDAARTEQKKIRLHLIGEDVGLESSLQQQLYEPLLHIVRNAVSHGVEAEEQRIAHGKQPTGTVTLEAHGGSNMLVITVRDDGRGLDYDALRRRGLEMGLIASDRAYTRPELARLIFHPGFSTRTSTSQISGRGVGMDVVQTVLERLHSWIEVDSVPGQGTSVRLLVPLHSVIEHVMVFRASGQDFAIPTQFVKYAGDPTACDTSEFPLQRLADLFPTLPAPQTAQPQLLVMACEAEEDATDDAYAARDSRVEHHVERRFGLLVDEIVGPEEVVVRPLPTMLAQQRLFAGVTLSGTGDIMLLFNSQDLLRRGLQAAEDPLLQPSEPTIGTAASNDCQDMRVLVVDDSRSSRRALVRALHRYATEVDEATDGADALRRLKEQSYDLIFTDLEMPQMGGMDLLREVRNHPRHAKTPVIIVSSRGEDVFRQRARELGVTDYLTKPVSEPLVTQAMERFQQQQERQLV